MSRPVPAWRLAAAARCLAACGVGGGGAVIPVSAVARLSVALRVLKHTYVTCDRLAVAHAGGLGPFDLIGHALSDSEPLRMRFYAPDVEIHKVHHSIAGHDTLLFACYCNVILIVMAEPPFVEGEGAEHFGPVIHTTRENTRPSCMLLAGTKGARAQCGLDPTRAWQGCRARRSAPFPPRAG